MRYEALSKPILTFLAFILLRLHHHQSVSNPNRDDQKMRSRAFAASDTSQRPNFFTKTRLLFLTLTISISIIVLISILYFLYRIWSSLISQRAKTIPFDSTTPLKLQRFSYKQLRKATNNFDSANIIGKGGSGTVFRGILGDGKLIAIKRLDSVSLQTEREFQNECQILGGLRSTFLVTLLGYCMGKSKRLLVYEYMPNKSLQESLFSDRLCNLSWERRFEIILDVSRALEFLHLGCDPPVIHGDVKPSNILLDSEYRAKISDFGLSRIKMQGDFGVDLFSQDLGKSQELWKSQELSGNLTPTIGTPVESSSTEVDFSLALQASSSSKNSRTCYNKALNLNYNANIVKESDSKGGNVEGKQVSSLDISGDGWKHKFVPCEDELSSIEHSKELDSNACSGVDDVANSKQPGKSWWWRQDGRGELCSKDYVSEWIGTQICSSTNPDWDEDTKNISAENLEDVSEPDFQERLKNPSKGFDNRERRGTKDCKQKQKIQEWWKEEHYDEISKKGLNLNTTEKKGKKKSFKMPHFDLVKRFYLRGQKKTEEQGQNESGLNGEFSFRRGWKKKSPRSTGCDMDLFSHELSSTTSIRGTLCYVAPEYTGCGFLMEKADIYSLGVLIIVIVSGRRPLHVLASPMNLEKANLISWCRHLAQSGNILELVDERLKDEYSKDQASLCINLGLICLQKIPELRPEIGEIVKILKGEMDLPPIPFEFSPSSSKLYSKSRRKPKVTAE